MRKLAFRVVSFRQYRITGWVFDEREPQHRLTIDLIIGDKVVGSTLANVIRRDLDKKVHPDRLVGYHTFLPLELWTGDVHDISVVVRETGTVLARQRLRTTSYRIAGAEKAMQGELGEAGPQRIAGWVSDGGAPLDVSIEIDGKVIYEGPADDELQMVGLTPAGFNVPIPPPFFDGQSHEIAAYVRTTSGRLPLGQKQAVLAVEDAPRINCTVDTVTGTSVRGRATVVRDPERALNIALDIDGKEIARTTSLPQEGGRFTFELADDRKFDPLDSTLALRVEPEGLVLPFDWPEYLRETCEVSALRQPDGAVDIILQSGVPLPPSVTARIDAPGLNLSVQLTAPKDGATLRTVRLKRLPTDIEKFTIACGLMRTDAEIVSPEAPPELCRGQIREEIGDYVPPNHAEVTRRLDELTKGIATEEGDPRCPSFSGSWKVLGQARIRGWVLDLSRPASSFIVQILIDDTVVGLARTGLTRQGAPVQEAPCGFFFDLKSLRHRGACNVTVRLAEGPQLPPLKPNSIELTTAPEDFEALPKLRSALAEAARRASAPKGGFPALDAGNARALSRLVIGVDDPEGLTGVAADTALLTLLRDDRFRYDVLPRLARPSGRPDGAPDASGWNDEIGRITQILSVPESIQARMAAVERRSAMLLSFLAAPVLARLFRTNSIADHLAFARILQAGIPEASIDLEAFRTPEGDIRLSGLPTDMSDPLKVETYDDDGKPLSQHWLAAISGQATIPAAANVDEQAQPAYVAIAIPLINGKDDAWVIRAIDAEQEDIAFTPDDEADVARLCHATALFAKGDFDAVLEVTGQGGSYGLALLRVRAMREIGRLKEALAAARALSSAFPAGREGWLLVLRLHRDIGSYEAGLAEATTAVGHFRADPEFTGLCEILLKKWLGTLSSTPPETDFRVFLDAFASEAPEIAEFFQREVKRIASLHSAAKEHAAVIALMEPLLPRLNGENRSILAAVMRAVKRYDKARSLATASLSANPDDMRAVRVLRDVALDERNFGEAFHLNSIVLGKKATFDSLLTQARIYVALASNGYGAGHYLNPIPPAQAYAAGVRLLEDLVKDHPNNYRGWWMLGQIYQHSQRYDLALRAFEKADALHPTDAHAMGIARMHIQEGNFEKAATLCRLTLQRNPDNAGATYTLRFLEGPDVGEMAPAAPAAPAVTIVDQAGLAFEGMIANVSKLFGIELKAEYIDDREEANLVARIVDACRAEPMNWFVLPVGDGVVLEDFATFAFTRHEGVGAIFSSVAIGHFTPQVFIRAGLMAEIVEALPTDLSFKEIAERVQTQARLLLRTNLPDDGGRAMSVAIVSRHGWLGFGGAEQFMRNIAKAYAEAGYEVWIIGISPGLADQQGEEDGIFWGFVDDLNGLRRLLMEKRFGVVHATGLVYDIAKAADQLNISIVYGFHFFRDLIQSLSADDGYYPRITDEWPARPEGKALLREISVLYANSQYSRKMIEAKFRVRVPVIYSTSYEVPELSEGQGEVILLMNARADKGFSMLLEMAARLPHRQFVAVANQSSSVMAQRWLHLRRLSNVTILERTDNIDALYTSARVVIVPSFEFVETFSRVVIEAQSRGRVVIGADAGNIPYLLAESGFLLAEDPVLWAETAERMFTDPEAYGRARERALANTRRFSAEVFRSQAKQAITSLNRRILVGVGAGIGNVIHATPLIRLIARHFGTSVDIVLSEGGTNYFDVLDNPEVVGSLMALGPMALSKPYDLVFLTNCFGDLMPAFNTARQISSRSLDRFIPGQSAHETIFNLEMGRQLLGINWDEADSHAYFFGDRAYEPPNSGIIAFHGGSKGGRWEAKRWPHYTRLAEALVADGYRVVSVGIPEEHVPGTEDWTGGTVGEMADRLMQTDYLVSNDSGVMNIGNALGLPLTAIFAPTEAATRGPLRPTSRIVALQKDCSPCEVKNSAHFNAGLCRCIGEISFEEVLASVRAGFAAARHAEATRV